jgi:hypothetical protein
VSEKSYNTAGAVDWFIRLSGMGHHCSVQGEQQTKTATTAYSET